MSITIVWINMLRSDDRYSAYLRSTEYDDSRVSYYWDQFKLTGVEWQEALGIDGIAWDVYFLYDRNATWDGMPTNPEFWMHQLGFPPEIAPALDGDILSDQIAKMIGSKTANEE